MSSGLLGIQHSNRKDLAHWSKNCFNSSFPTSLACYFMKNYIPAVYAKLAVVNGVLQVVCEEIAMQQVFRTETYPEDLRFDFEVPYPPFQEFSKEPIDGIDLVVKTLDGDFLAPIEIKLTVLPTSATAHKPESEWGSEIVVRSATTSYLAFSIWEQIKGRRDDVREIFENTCGSVERWTNDYEMTHRTPEIKESLDLFEQEFVDYQRPLVMQAFWKTEGQSPVLCENAFDIVVWSDLAFSRLFLDTFNEGNMSRPMRASVRMARCLWELSKSGKIRIGEIYRQMAFGQQTDKEVSVNGDRWRRYITTNRTITPIVEKEALLEIIKPGYIEKLRPERRFDQTLYFSVNH